MKVRWIIVWIVLAVCFTGCMNKNGENEEEEVFSLSTQTQEKYKEAIHETLYSFYWRYDENSILYFKATVPKQSDEKGKEILNVSEESGFALKNYSGKDAVIATVDLLHFNGDKAGLAYIYFVKDKLAGIYYKGGYNNNVLSMYNRNVYMADGKFENYESNHAIRDFTEKRTAFPVDGFCTNGKDAKGNTMVAAIENEALSIYRFRNNFSRYRVLAVKEGELIPTSAVFLPQEEGGGNSLAVLLCKNESTEIEGDGRIISFSEKIVFYNDAFQKTGEMILPSTTYTALGVEDNNLIMVNGNMVEYYTKKEGNWEKISQYYMNHSVTCFKVADLDHNGVKEYLMSDGMDFYVYQKKGRSFKNIWRTHLSITSLMGSIYTGDLNRDGVDEVYLCDNTGTAIRYILTEKGLISQNEDISYGDRIYAFDFNDDGIDDYVKIVDIEKLQQYLYLGTEPTVSTGKNSLE